MTSSFSGNHLILWTLLIKNNLYVICLAGLFAFAGFYQMAVWALGKHRNYKKEFSDYPKCRKSIIPFLL